MGLKFKLTVGFEFLGTFITLACPALLDINIMSSLVSLPLTSVLQKDGDDGDTWKAILIHCEVSCSRLNSQPLSLLGFCSFSHLPKLSDFFKHMETVC